MLRFEGGSVLRSHLRMSGSWRLLQAGEPIQGRPWLIVRGSSWTAVLRGGSVLELTDRAVSRLGPDILADPPDLDAMVARLRLASPERELGDALLDQRLVAGICNVWRAEALWCAGLSPWLRIGAATDDELRRVLTEAARLMRHSRDGVRAQHVVYRRAGRPCPRCGGTVLAKGQGDGNRTAYWCPGCQRRNGGMGSPAP